MKQPPDYKAMQRISFFLNPQDRIIGTQDPSIYVQWEGGSREGVHGFVLHWGARAIHFLANYKLGNFIDQTTKKKEETLEWTITSIGTRSWKSDVGPFEFSDIHERRIACELAVKALAIFPRTYNVIATHTSARLSEAIQNSLYGRIH
jgi:hypothetical protein